MTTTTLRFYGGLTSAFVPIAGFLVFCVLFFIVFRVFDMTALAMAGFVSLLVGAIFAKRYEHFWECVMRGIGSPTSVAIIVILFMVGMTASLIKTTNVSGGFVWLASTLGITGGPYPLFVFIAVSVVAMSTGSSIGTFFLAFPIFYPSGVALGAEPVLIAGAILSGGILGDNLAPISDTTIISSSSQRFRRKSGVADVGGVVKHRSRYALVAAALTGIVLLVMGFVRSGAGTQATAPEGANTALPLVMLIPVGVILLVAIRTRSIFAAVSVGVALGGLVGLATGLLTPTEVLGVNDGKLTGFMYEGVAEMVGTVALVIAVFGIMGVLQGAGAMEFLVEKLSTAKLVRYPRGAETAIGVGATVATLLFGGVNSAAMLSFGTVADEIGAKVNLHPYRRANVMDCFSLGIASTIPFLSAYLFIGSQLTAGYGFRLQLSTFDLFPATVYPIILTAVMIVSVSTGWGRAFEGDHGVAIKKASKLIRPCETKKRG